EAACLQQPELVPARRRPPPSAGGDVCLVLLEPRRSLPGPEQGVLARARQAAHPPPLPGRLRWPHLARLARELPGRDPRGVARARRFCGLVAAGLPAFVVVVSVQGWLYEMRAATLIGPRLHDALPLDELPRHDSVSLVLFVGVWACAGIAVGLLARKARVER